MSFVDNSVARQRYASTPLDAMRNFKSSCNVCCIHNFRLDCDTCPVSAVHAEVMKCFREYSAEFRGTTATV